MKTETMSLILRLGFSYVQLKQVLKTCCSNSNIGMVRLSKISFTNIFKEIKLPIFTILIDC